MVALRFRNFVPGALGHRSIVPGALGNWPKAAAAEAMVDIKDAFESEPGLLEDVALLKDVIEPGEPAPTAPVNPGILSLSSSDLGAEACGVKNDHVVVKEEATTTEAAAKSAAAEVSAAAEAAATKFAAAESATEKAVASAAPSTFSSGVASAASSGFAPAVATKASSIASLPTTASGKGATCLAAATACLAGAAAAPAGFFASAFSWLATGPPKVAAAAAALAVIGAVMWRRNSKARRLGWSSLLGILLCLATVSGGLVTAAGGAALAASSPILSVATAASVTVLSSMAACTRPRCGQAGPCRDRLTLVWAYSGLAQLPFPLHSERCRRWA